MKLFDRPDVYDKWKTKITDWDVATFWNMFDEPEGAKILEVGSHDEPCNNMLVDMGYDVTGIDLREYDKTQPPCNYKYIRADFCDLPKAFFLEHMETFDVIYSLSALEHFGLNTYSEGETCSVYDIIAVRTIWQLLKPGGAFYFTVPYCKRHINAFPHWRVYDHASLGANIIQDFTISKLCIVAATDIITNSKIYRAGDLVSLEDANEYSGNPPHLNVGGRLIKIPMMRLAPNGR